MVRLGLVEGTRLVESNRLVESSGLVESKGLVERFNTLKGTLRKLCQERLSDWDCYLPAVLFAHTEVPHESARFSLFQLLHRRTASGPVSILKEWYFPPHFRQRRFRQENSSTVWKSSS